MGLTTSASLAIVLVPRLAVAWNFDEHQSLGGVAYAQACDLVSMKVSGKKSTPAEKERLALVCPNSATAKVFAQHCAVAGDLVSSPEELTSDRGSANATSEINYLSLALLNNVHFQPFSRRGWESYHARALEAAVQDSIPGESLVARLEVVLSQEAFAQHFLQDSFSSGHMGFNRAASTAGAAKLFHDTWNERGRWVRSPSGDTWLTYGDGTLSKCECRKPIERAAAGSLAGVLFAFVLKEQDDHLFQEVSDAIPNEVADAYSDAYRSRLERKLGMQLSGSALQYGENVGLIKVNRIENLTFTPLATIRQPAIHGFELSVVEITSLQPGGQSSTGGLLSLNVPFFMLPGFYPVGFSLSLGAMHFISTDQTESAFAISMFLSCYRSENGFVTAELGPGIMGIGEASTATRLQIPIRVRAELGVFTVSLVGGPEWATRSREWPPGYFVGLAVGRMFRVVGGAPLN